MMIHLINDKDKNRGGAQKILALIHGITGGKVLCLRDSVIAQKPLALIHIYLMVLYRVFCQVFRRVSGRTSSNLKVVGHSRMYLPLLFVLRSFVPRGVGVKTYFYLHASYRSKPWLFKYFKVSQYIAVSQSAKDYLIEQGITASKITVIYNPLLQIETDEQCEKNEQNLHLNWQQQRENKKVNIFSVGALQPWKGFKEAIQILDQACRKLDIAIDYRIVGQGPELQNLQKQVLNLENSRLSVKFLGFSNCPYQLVNGSYIQLIPSLEEGFGLTMIEGITQSKLIIYRQIPSLNELAQKDPFSFGFDHSNDVIDHLNALICGENLLKDKKVLKNRQRAIELEFSYDNFVVCVNDTLK